MQQSVQRSSYKQGPPSYRGQLGASAITLFSRVFVNEEWNGVALMIPISEFSSQYLYRCIDIARFGSLLLMNVDVEVIKVNRYAHVTSAQARVVT